MPRLCSFLLCQYQCFRWSYESPTTYFVVQAAWVVDRPAIVPHRLAVAPAARGIGVATAFLQRAEILARENGCNLVRIDTNVQNKIMQRYRVCGCHDFFLCFRFDGVLVGNLESQGVLLGPTWSLSLRSPSLESHLACYLHVLKSIWSPVRTFFACAPHHGGQMQVAIPCFLWIDHICPNSSSLYAHYSSASCPSRRGTLRRGNTLLKITSVFF